MGREPRPRFSLADAVVLVGATALALAATRSSWPLFSDPSDFGGDFPTRMYVVRSMTYEASIFLAAWSLACLGRGLRRPRPDPADLLSRPGMAACTTAAVVLAARMVNLGITLAVHAPEPPWPELFLVPSEVGCAVAATWVIQAISRRWCPEPTWVDRVGRFLGVAWIATIPFAWFSWTTE